MALADTFGAIGAVTNALVARISARTQGMNVTVGRPDQNTAGTHLNLFLYEISYDPTLKNFSLDEGQKPPIWMVLKYILTAFAETPDNTSSDSAEAHTNLGRAIQAIYQDDLLRLNGLPGTIVQALESNPRPLHVTFDEAPVDLLAKLMQGTDEKLRISVAFQVRPVMIASPDAPDYSLLVGIDYTQPPTALAPEPVELDIIPSLGTRITEIVPRGFEAREDITIDGEEISVKGEDLHLSNLAVRLGTVDFPVTMQKPDELRFKVDVALINAAGMSAGSHPLTVVQTLPSGKRRASNMMVANLVPTLLNATFIAPNTIELEGVLLGAETDDAVAALYTDGRVFRMFDVLTPPPVPPATPQTVRRFEIADVPAGVYLIILRVNGQQAPQSPQVTVL